MVMPPRIVSVKLVHNSMSRKVGIPEYSKLSPCLTIHYKPEKALQHKSERYDPCGLSVDSLGIVKENGGPNL